MVVAAVGKNSYYGKLKMKIQQAGERLEHLIDSLPEDES